MSSRRIEDSRIINHTANNLYDLVMDIESYKEFLPWCHESRIIYESKNENLLHGHLGIGIPPVLKSFESKVVYDDKLLVIETELIKGVFSHMKSQWDFVPISKNKTDVKFSMDFTVKFDLISGAILEKMYESAFNKMVSCFADRADTIYGVNRGD